MKFILRSLPILILLALWQASAELGWVRSQFLSSPFEIGKIFLKLIEDGSLFENLLASLGRILVGFSIASVLGVGAGLVLGLSPRLRFFFEPMLVILRPVPPLAWVPLSILWFGIGNGPAYFVTAISAFFPIFTNSLAGIDGTPKHYQKLVKMYGVSRWLAVTDVVVPSALPFIMTGLRIGFMVAWMSVIAAEMVSSDHGIGYFIEASQEMLNPASVIVGMISIGVVGFFLDGILSRTERRLRMRIGASA